MTVTRSRRVGVQPRADLAGEIRAGLSSDSRFRDLRRTPGGYQFRYRPRFWPLVLSTRVDVKILQPPRYEVEVVTTSQRAIVGDIFRAYAGILDRVEAAIRTTVRD